LKALLPNTTISSNVIIPAEDMIIEEEDRLRIYEFDVSFVKLSLLLIQKIFIPHLSLALEYQGEHHYSSHFFGSALVRQRRDQAKLKFARQFGITLISIPFWWDKSSDSLASTLHYYRPDIKLQAKEVPPIPLEMPVKIKKQT
jgi:hypothetical protein